MLALLQTVSKIHLTNSHSDLSGCLLSLAQGNPLLMVSLLLSLSLQSILNTGSRGISLSPLLKTLQCFSTSLGVKIKILTAIWPPSPVTSYLTSSPTVLYPLSLHTSPHASLMSLDTRAEPSVYSALLRDIGMYKVCAYI